MSEDFKTSRWLFQANAVRCIGSRVRFGGSSDTAKWAAIGMAGRPKVIASPSVELISQLFLSLTTSSASASECDLLGSLRLALVRLQYYCKFDCVFDVIVVKVAQVSTIVTRSNAQVARN